MKAASRSQFMFMGQSFWVNDNDVSCSQQEVTEFDFLLLFSCVFFFTVLGC